MKTGLTWGKLEKRGQMEMMKKESNYVDWKLQVQREIWLGFHKIRHLKAFMILRVVPSEGWGRISINPSTGLMEGSEKGWVGQWWRG